MQQQSEETRGNSYLWETCKDVSMEIVLFVVNECVSVLVCVCVSVLIAYHGCVS